jgi:hypothetical protein
MHHRLKTTGVQTFYFDHSEKDPTFNTFLKYGDADYFKTYGLSLQQAKYDVSDTARQVVVNETFIHKLGIQKADNAIGKTVKFRRAWHMGHYNRCCKRFQNQFIARCG